MPEIRKRQGRMKIALICDTFSFEYRNEGRKLP
jgi:hypothetical protein